MRNPLSAIFQCADAIISALTSYQEIGFKSPSNGGRVTNASVFGAEDPIAYAIEAASTITLCAQHQKVLYYLYDCGLPLIFVQRIVDDVLVLSKVDANLIEIHPIDCQPGILIENALKMFSAELQANGAQMTFNIEDSYQELKIDWVKLDPGRLLQV